MFRSILLTGLLFAFTPCAAAQESRPTQEPSDRQGQEQAGRERREEERRRKAEGKEAQRKAGVRCARLHRKTGG